MNCREINDFLMDYVNRELPAPERDIFEAHLGLCPECVDYLRSYEQTIKLSHECAAPPCDAGPPPERLIQAILAICPTRSGSCEGERKGDGSGLGLENG
jgi:anti-sigma factor RsiW